MTIATGQLMTADELLALGEDFHGELVRGRLIEMAPASWGHGITGSRALRLIGNYVDQKNLGLVFIAETGFVLYDDPATVRAPDVAFVNTSRVPKAGGSGFFKGPPDLAVEIVSPSETQPDILEKVDDYLQSGTRLIWIINTERKTIGVFAPGKQPLILRETDNVNGGEVLPGFVVPVAEFFK